MIYITITLTILLIVGTIFFSSFREKNSDFTNVIITIIGTFIGIFAGIYFTNHEQKKQDIQSFENLVALGLAEVTNISEEFEKLNNFYKDSSKTVYLKTLQLNKFSDLSLLQSITQNQIFQNNACFCTNGNVVQMIRQIEKMSFSVYRIDKSENIDKLMDVYVAYLKMLSQILYSEIERIADDKDCKELNEYQYTLIQETIRREK